MEFEGINIKDFDSDWDEADMSSISTQEMVGAAATGNPTDSAPPSTTNTNPLPTNLRFCDPVSPAEIYEKFQQTLPANTSKQNRWAYNVWLTWSNYRNHLKETLASTFYPVPEYINGDVQLKRLDFWMAHFIHEVRRQDGNPYPPKTLENLSAALQRTFREDCDYVGQ